MWVLIVLQLMSAGATSKNSMPIAYSGVVMQEFSSQQSCEQAKEAISHMNADRNNQKFDFNVRDGIVSFKCVKK